MDWLQIWRVLISTFACDSYINGNRSPTMPNSCDSCSPAAHLMLVVVVPLLQEGALLGMHLGTNGGPATLRLLRDVYLG